jgi:hypothetical protein
MFRIFGECPDRQVSWENALVPDTDNVDNLPLGGRFKPKTNPGGSFVPVVKITSPNLPYDSKFIGNDIPKTMMSCHSYLVNVKVQTPRLSTGL